MVSTNRRNNGGLLLSFLIAVTAVSLLMSPVRADLGIGLFTTTNAETIMEGSTLCVTYKIYNPFDTDIYGVLSPGGDLANLTTYVDPPVFVPKGTLHRDGIDRKICFTAGQIHSDCIIGEAFCRTCSAKTYEGAVVASTGASGTGGGMGSSTSASAAQQFRLNVVCNPNPPLPFRYFVYGVGIIILAGALWWAKKNVRIGIEIGPKKTQQAVAEAEQAREMTAPALPKTKNIAKKRKTKAVGKRKKTQKKRLVRRR